MRVVPSKPALLAILCVVTGLASCRSSSPEEGPSDSWRDARGTVPGSFSSKSYNLSFVSSWEVAGAWVDVRTPWGRAKRATGEGPHAVHVQVTYEAAPRLHEVGGGTVVGASGESLLIEDPTEAGELARSE